MTDGQSGNEPPGPARETAGAGQAARRAGTPARDALARFDEAFLPDEPAAPVATGPEPSFRDRALGGSANPLDNIDHLFRNTSRRLWLGLAGLVVIAAAGIVWTAAAKLSVIERGEAVVVPPDGFFVAGQGVAGRVTGVLATTGQHVATGQPIATVATAAGPVTVTSPLDGEVVAVDARAGDVTSGAGLVRLARSGAPPSAVGLFGVAQVSSLAVGQPVEVAVNGFSPGRYGSVRARVGSIAAVPVSTARLQQLTADPSLASSLAQAGPLYEVDVALQRSGTPSGVAWTRGSGPSTAVPFGALAVASVTVERQSLLHKAFG